MVAKKITARIERMISDSYQRGLGIRDIAEVVDLSYDTVRQALVRNGVARRSAKAHDIHSHHDDEIKALYLRGESTATIGNKLRISSETVRRHLQRMKVPLRNRIEAIIAFHRTR